MAAQEPQSLRGLKALVIGMGVLIVAGFVVIAVTLFNRISDRSAKRAEGQPAEAGVSGDMAGGGTLAAFDDTKIDIPYGARVIETAASGGRLVVHLRLRDGTAAFVVVDLATGGRLGTVELRSPPRPEPAGAAR